jgi:hypothetical protein
MRRTLLHLFVAASAFIFIFSMANSASAQRRDGRMARGQVRLMVDNLENRMDVFVREYDNSLDHSRLNGSNREDWLNRRAQSLEQATDALRNDFDRHNDWYDSRQAVSYCLNVALDIDRNMSGLRLDHATRNNWEHVRGELNTLADVYQLQRIGYR